MPNPVVELKREVTAVQIPSGDVLALPEKEHIYDPEIPVDIVNLDLIYDVTVNQKGIYKLCSVG